MLKLVKLSLIGLVILALVVHALFLLLTRKPVLAHVISSSLPEATRYSYRRMQVAKIGDALSVSEDGPTESVSLRLRYEVEGQYYHKDVCTTVRKGDRPDATQMLWYDPNDPSRATDTDISWIGLSLAFISFLAVAFEII